MNFSAHYREAKIKYGYKNRSVDITSQSNFGINLHIDFGQNVTTQEVGKIDQRFNFQTFQM
jgi:hypothetical protein